MTPLITVTILKYQGIKNLGLQLKHMANGAGDMARWEKALASKHNNLNLLLRTHWVEGES